TIGIIGADSTVANVTWQLSCPNFAKIQLAANSNRDLVTSTNFLTLSGSGNTFGTFGVNITGCRFDGNKANQTALATRGSGTISTVPRAANGAATIVFSN